jgi:uncharacterized metal-binding protein (TIGR02443 family)
METYLRENQYYEDRYDLGTIEECLGWYNRMKTALEQGRSRPEFKDFTDEQFAKDTHQSLSILINVIKMERFRGRKETLRKWIDEDRRLQDKYDKAVAPKDVLCKKCYSPTKVILKNLRDSFDGNSMVLFGFECLDCQDRQALFEDGSKWVYTSPKCPECQAPLKIDMQSENDVLITRTDCTKCSYTKEEVSDHKEFEKSERERRAKEQELLENYKKEFCYDEKKGLDAILHYDQLKAFVKEWEETKKKEENPVFKKAQQFKKLTLGQVEKLLEGPMGTEGYKDLRFGKPEIAKYVIVDFSLTDEMDGRSEYDSQKALKKVLRVVLEQTNWRLMSEGISYRLGILTGRLKAYESDEDLMKLID